MDLYIKPKTSDVAKRFALLIAVFLAVGLLAAAVESVIGIRSPRLPASVERVFDILVAAMFFWLCLKDGMWKKAEPVDVAVVFSDMARNRADDFSTKGVTRG